MTSDALDKTTEGYAMTIADDSYSWYQRRAADTRRAYRASEVIFIIVSASIPIAGIIAPTNAMPPAILGALVVIISGLRSVFHWQENYLRFSSAREAVEAERRLYRTRSNPYEDPAKRDQILVARISKIEQDEMGVWMEISTAKRRNNSIAPS